MLKHHSPAKSGHSIIKKKIARHVVLQMENCSDGFNVPREHTAKLYIVGKRIMGGASENFVRMNEKWSRFSKIRVKGQISKSKKNYNKIKLPIF